MAAITTRQAIELAERSLVGHAGLIRSLEHILTGPGEPRVCTVSSITASIEHISKTFIPGSQGACDFTWDEATIGAIGESIERYCAAWYEWGDLIYASETELGPEAVGMEKFSLYTDDIYDQPNTFLSRYDKETPCYWVSGRSLHTGETRYVPAAMAYTPYRRDSPKKAPIHATAVSTGQACHTDPIQATLSGLYEAIERDAFMITWMRRIPPKRLNFRADPYLNSIYEHYFECRSVEFHLFDISLDVRVPTVLCVGTGISERGPFINVGAATRASERDACIKALKEGAQGTAWVRELVPSRSTWRPEPDFSNLVNFEDHLFTYSFPEMTPHVDFIMKTALSRDVADDAPGARDPKQALAMTLAAVAERGFEAIEVDLTTPEIAELGFHVPKVIVPGFAHLTAVHSMPALAIPRYSEVPAALGLTDPIHGQWNPVPHPFP